MPRPNKGNQGRLETSVCRSQYLTDTQIWEICAEHFDRFVEKPAIGRGDGLARVVFDVGLALDADGMPYPEHANIVGWHAIGNAGIESVKHIWMDQAQRMAPHFAYRSRIG